MPQSRFFRRSIGFATSWTRLIVSSVAIGTSMLLLSGFAGVGSSVQAQESSPESTSTSAEVYHTRFKSGPGEGIREVAIEGAVRFSPDEKRIEWLDDGAYLRIITEEKGRKLQFDAKADGHGRPTVGHQVDGQARPYDEDAARYLADILPVMFRELGHNEVERVRITYDQDGADGVIRMISEIRSDYSQSLHVSAFLGLEGLSDDEIIDTYSVLGHQINTDYELAAFLYQTSDLYRERPGVRQAYLDCLNLFQSDIERSRTSQNLFGMESIAGDEQPAMIMDSGC